MPDVFAFTLFFSPLLLAFFILFSIILDPSLNISTFASGLFIIFISCAGCLFSYKVLCKSWFTWTHYPVRFNRKTKMVHVFKVDGTILSVPWKEVFFTRGRAGPGAMPEWSIDGHILAEDGKTVIDTFSLGFSNTRQELITNWAFVRSYMEVEDCLSDLKDIIVLCPPVAEHRESFIFGLQYMMRVESRLEWPFTLILLPLTLLGGVARFVAMHTSKIPRWSAAVEEDCRVAPDDPINVSAANNPKHIWRYVLANQSLEEYNALYQRQTAAMARLREKVRKSVKAGRVQGGDK
ncbi:DUF6708 domain-containing protein [Nissabacter archeti]|uniref:DUF6708 domain-containing protein n=1 Tax=Nissabacter archeti TaxID=1917880 RepID=UPI0030B8661B